MIVECKHRTQGLALHKDHIAVRGDKVSSSPYMVAFVCSHCGLGARGREQGLHTQHSLHGKVNWSGWNQDYSLLIHWTVKLAMYKEGSTFKREVVTYFRAQE